MKFTKMFAGKERIKIDNEVELVKNDDLKESLDLNENEHAYEVRLNNHRLDMSISVYEDNTAFLFLDKTKQDVKIESDKQLIDEIMNVLTPQELIQLMMEVY